MISNKFFERMIRVFKNSSNKNGIFDSLCSWLLNFLVNPEEYTVEYLQMFLDMLFNNKMPLHAAVAAGYLQENNYQPDRISAFMEKLHGKCEKDFIEEISSSEPDIQHCADLHTAFSFLSPEYEGTSIPEAVEKLTDEQRKVLFQEVGRCACAANVLKEEEKDLLAPILKYFSLHYPEEINGSFLEENQEQFSGQSPDKATLTELLVNAIKNKHFSYFRVLYSIFSNWSSNQTDVTSEQMMELGFDNVQTPEQLLDILYVSLELAKKGKPDHTIPQLQQWYDRLRSRVEGTPVSQVISYLYYAHCIESDLWQIDKYVHGMPKYDEDALFSHILPSHRFPIGGQFLMQNANNILKKNSSVMREYLEKLGNNNIYHFDTDLDCPEVRSFNSSYESLIRELFFKHSVEDILYFYFNTHLRMLVSLLNLRKFMDSFLVGEGFNEALKAYVFSMTMYNDYDTSGNMGVQFKILQFKNERIFPTSIIVHNSQCQEKYVMKDLLKLAFPKGKKINIHILRLHFSSAYPVYEEQISEEDKKNTAVDIQLLLSNEDFNHLEKCREQWKQDAENAICSVLSEIIQSKNITDRHVDEIENESYKTIYNERILSLYADALEILAYDVDKQIILAELMLRDEPFECQNHALLMRIYNLLKTMEKNGFIGTFPMYWLMYRSPFNQIIDIIEIANISVEFDQIVYGTIHLNSYGQTELIPTSLISEKAPIIVYSPNNFYDMDVISAAGFLHQELVDWKHIDLNISFPYRSSEGYMIEFHEGKEYKARIYLYVKEKNCFLCDLIGVCEELENEKKRIEDILFILRKARTDDSAITNPPQKVFSEPLKYSSTSIYSYKISEMYELMYEAIINRLKLHNKESVVNYMDTIKPCNPFYEDIKLQLTGENEFYLPYFSPDYDTLQYMDKLQYILDVVVEECDPKLIARIYQETGLHLDIKMNQFLHRAYEKGKLEELIACLQDFRITASFISTDFSINEMKDLTTTYQNIDMGKFSIDGIHGERQIETNLGESLKLRLTGYDPETDIVYLTTCDEG